MWLVSFLCTFSGIFIGGMMVWLFKGLQQKVDLIYGLCAGIILGLMSFEIFPEAIELDGWLSTLLGFIVGMIVFQVLHNVFHNSEDKKSTSEKKLYIRTGLLLIVSFSIHNVPMGMILGASKDADFTMALLQTLVFHSIPEGIILFTPLLLAGTNTFTALFVTFIVSIPVSLGVFIGSFLGWNDPIMNTALTGFTIGIIFLVTISEILYPALMKYSIVKVVSYTLMGLGV